VIIWLCDYLSFNCRNSSLGFDGMFMYLNWMIIVLLMMNLHAKSYICGYVMFLCKIDEEWSCGFGLWVSSWLDVVVVVMECVVDELMHWVFIVMDWWCKILSCWNFYENGFEMNKFILLSRIKLSMMRLMYKWLDDISMKNWVCLSLILNLGRA